MVAADVVGAAKASQFVISGWLGVLMALVGIAGAAGFIVAYFDRARVKTNMGLTQKSIDLYRIENEAQGKRIATLEDERTQLKAEAAECRGAIAVLTEAVTQSAKVEMLANSSDGQHRALLVRLETISKSLKAVRNKLGIPDEPDPDL